MTANGTIGLRSRTREAGRDGVVHPPNREAVGRWLAYVAFLLAFAVLTLTAIAHVAPWPDLAARADIASPLAGHAMFVGALAAIAVLMPRGAFAALIAASVVAILGHAGLTLRSLRAIPFAETPATDATRELRFLTLNGWHHHRDPARLEAAIAASGADVVVLSEAGPDRAPMLRRLASVYPYSENCVDRTECSLAILSRLPISDSGSGRTDLASPPLVWVRVDASSRALGSLTIVGTHLHRPSRDALIHRRHIDAIATLVASIPGPLVLAGDFNTSPYSASYRYLVRRTGLTPVAPMLPTWPAWPALLPQVALDHIFVSENLIATGVGAGPVSGSDHLPIWATLRTTPPPARAVAPATAGKRL